MFSDAGQPGGGVPQAGGAGVRAAWGVTPPLATVAPQSPRERTVAQVSLRNMEEGNAPVGHRDAELFIQGVLNEAISRTASDIHFEPRSGNYRIRLRIDGVLHEYLERPLEEYASVLNTVKVLADVDIAEHSLPQDGHIEVAVAMNDRVSDAHVFDVRVSTFPSVNGEVVVMRVLNRSDALLSVDALGMDETSFTMLRTMLLSSFGMILVTGPTGSGKTTTLYSMMRELKSTEKNMITLEDPIEFHLDWMRQCEIREERGFTYERAMAAVLRQDPDVLMVGEVRDAQTAEYAVRSALVGHLVGCTIHANTTTGTIARLLDLGVPRSSLAHALNGIIAQRLVRRVCERCRETYAPDRFHLEHFGLDQSSRTYYRGRGCAQCNGTGYAGRMAIYSVMLITDVLRGMIFEQRSMVDIQNQAINEGMRTLKMDAVAKVLAGITTVEEAARVI